MICPKCGAEYGDADCILAGVPTDQCPHCDRRK